MGRPRADYGLSGIRRCDVVSEAVWDQEDGHGGDRDEGAEMDLMLAGKIAVVTGASKGIGLAVTKALAQEGAHVLAGALTADSLADLAGSPPWRWTCPTPPLRPRSSSEP